MPLSVHKPPWQGESKWCFHAVHSSDPTEVLVIRPVTPDDTLRQKLFFEAMSPDDRFKRFFAPKNYLSPSELRGMTHVDYNSGFALAAVSRATDLFVGTARVFTGGAGEAVDAEAAVVVLSSHGGRGIGSLLVDLMFRAAIEDLHAARLHIEHLLINHAVRHLFQKIGGRHSTAREELPVEDGVCRVSWTLKRVVDQPSSVTPRHAEHFDVDGPDRKFEVLRPPGQPMSVLCYELQMKMPHEGYRKRLAIRPMTPDDLQREVVFLRNLGADLWNFNKARLGEIVGSITELSTEEMARTLTSYDFGTCCAIAAIDERLDSIVAVARFCSSTKSQHAEALLAVLDSWFGFGVGSFVYDVMVQIAVREGKSSLRFMVPEAMSQYAEVAKRITARHSDQVTATVTEKGVYIVDAVLKKSVEKATRLTRVPGVAVESTKVRAGSMQFFEPVVPPATEALPAVAPEPPLAVDTTQTAVIAVDDLEDDNLWGY